MKPNWRWNHPRSRYEAKLEDGSELRAIYHRSGRAAPRTAREAGSWTARVFTAWDANWSDLDQAGQPFPDGDAAKRGALEWYEQRRPATSKPRRKR